MGEKKIVKKIQTDRKEIMAKKINRKKAGSLDKPLTERVFLQYVYGNDKRMDGMDQRSDRMERKMEDYRVEAREHLNTVVKGLHQKIDGVDLKLSKKIDHVDEKLTQKIDKVYEELKFTQGAIRSVKEDTLRHDKTIGKLQKAVFNR